MVVKVTITKIMTMTIWVTMSVILLTQRTNLYTKTNGWAVSGPYEDKVVVVNLPAKQANKKEGLPAVPGGIMIQLPNNIGTTEPITLKFELVDVFGVTKTLSVTVKAAK
ncbi:hypothetical protein B5F25_20900 [Bacteroides sp. An19]|nr:hypothetical protein B5F25_20900 [Bacteroides sp. An19]